MQREIMNKILIEAYLLFDEILQAKAVNSLFNSLRSPIESNPSTITSTYIEEKKVIQYDNNILYLAMIE